MTKKLLLSVNRCWLHVADAAPALEDRGIEPMEDSYEE